MPRVSAAEKERSHQRILKEASKAFRTKGLAGTSVGDVMIAAGLTHGGFYRHFQSKADLLAAALEDSIKGAMSELEKAETAEAQKEALWRYVDVYLSPEHVRSPQDGCPLAAIAADAGRSDAILRETADRGSQYAVSLLSRALANQVDDPEKRARALLSLLIGTITLARVSGRPEDIEGLLDAAKTTACQLVTG